MGRPKQKHKWIRGWECWQCADCGKFKRSAEYHKRRSRWNGILVYCKDCATRRNRVAYANDPNAREKSRISSLRDAEKNRDRICAYQRDYYNKNKKRLNARTPKFVAREAVKKAVYKGRLAKPTCCEDCGKPKEKHELHGHHEDYSRKLDVVWLCAICHGARHHDSSESYQSKSA